MLLIRDIMLSLQDLSACNVRLLGVYVKLLMLQLKTDIAVHELGVPTEPGIRESACSDKQEFIQHELSSANHCFLLRLGSDCYLISKVQIQGVVIYKDVKERRTIIGRKQ